MGTMHFLLLCAAICLPETPAFPVYLGPEAWGSIDLEEALRPETWSSMIDLEEELRPYPGSSIDLEEVMGYLYQFFPIFTETQNLNVEESIKEMQKFFQLPATGKLDAETEKIMNMPRCGMPDVAEYQTFPGTPKWEKTHLTYKILSYTYDLHPYIVDSAIERALRVWSDVTPLHFQRVYVGPADIEIKFARREHGDGVPFDGPGNVLAHAFPPGEGRGGDAHFDDDERWSDVNQGTNLFLVAAHEFGHSLGLHHSNVHGALMYPLYSYQNPETFRLPEDDRRGIQKLYGKKSSKKEEDEEEEYEEEGEEEEYEEEEGEKDQPGWCQFCPWWCGVNFPWFG